jgi:hypothetical protein
MLFGTKDEVRATGGNALRPFCRLLHRCKIDVGSRDNVALGYVGKSVIGMETLGDARWRRGCDPSAAVWPHAAGRVAIQTSV